MTLSVNEEKLTGLRARNCALTIQRVLILKFAFTPEQFPDLSRNGPQHLQIPYHSRNRGKPRTAQI